MKSRERIVNTLLGKPVDRAPFFCVFGPWGETVERWQTEGLGADRQWWEPFGFDNGFTYMDVNLGLQPWFPVIDIEDKGDTVVFQNQWGIIQEGRKDGGSIPAYLRHPVNCWEDWNLLKAERLNPHDPARFPADWAKKAQAYNEGEAATQLGWCPYGVFGTCRELMGVEELLVAFYDQPDLVKDMMDSLTDFWLTIWEKVIQDVKVDMVHIWEDMSGKGGSLISPRMFREFMLPNYRKVTAFAQKHGIPLVSVDTDGDCRELVPLFIEGGVNMVFPFEVAAGCDVNEYRRLYPKLGIIGGIDKQEIAKGSAAIDHELQRIAPMLEYSRYIPSIDHLIHPQISWSDFCYFVERLRELIFKLGTGSNGA